MTSIGGNSVPAGGLVANASSVGLLSIVFLIVARFCSRRPMATRARMRSPPAAWMLRRAHFQETGVRGLAS